MEAEWKLGGLGLMTINDHNKLGGVYINVYNYRMIIILIKTNVIYNYNCQSVTK